MAEQPENVTDSDIAMQDGNSELPEIADHEPSEVATPPRVAITERGRKTVQNYRQDVQEARVVATRPPSMGELIEQLWRHPSTLAGTGLERFAARAYAVLAIPVVAVLYCLVAAYVKPALGATVTAVFAVLVWMWIS